MSRSLCLTNRGRKASRDGTLQIGNFQFASVNPTRLDHLEFARKLELAATGFKARGS